MLKYDDDHVVIFEEDSHYSGEDFTHVNLDKLSRKLRCDGSLHRFRRQFTDLSITKPSWHVIIN